MSLRTTVMAEFRREVQVMASMRKQKETVKNSCKCFLIIKIFDSLTEVRVAGSNGVVSTVAKHSASAISAYAH